MKMTPNMGWFVGTFSDELEELDSQLIPLTKMEFCIFVYKVAEHLKILHHFNT
jgi:hypothetical protein